MEGPASIVVAAALVQNILLTQLIGVCPALAASRRLDLTVTHAGATAVVLVPAALAAWCIDHVLLIPAQLTALRLLVLVPLTAACVSLSAAVLRRRFALEFERISLQPALAGINCVAIAGVWIAAVDRPTLVAAGAAAVGTGAGYFAATVLLAMLHQRLSSAPLPGLCRGPVILLLSAGIASLALMGLAGAGRPS